MKCLLVLVAMASALSLAEAQATTCYSCSSTSPLPNDACYENPAALSGCLAGSSGDCYTTFTITDGLVNGVSRGCNSPLQNGECTTSYGGFPENVETTTCAYTCSSTNCNNQTSQSIVACSASCGPGFCDYTRGRCVCPTGFSGNVCETDTRKLLKCIQCNDATEATCAGSVAATDCPSSSYTHCAVSQTNLYDAGKNLVDSVIARGCAMTSNVDCKYSTPVDSSLTGYFEYTCTGSCTTDGCNSFAPIGSKPSLYCIQCSSTGSDCSGAATQCTTNQGYCYSRATYRTISNYNDQGYQLISVERGCSSTALTSRCTDNTYPSSNGVETTCEESCQTDGCNDGWPNRPKCYRCSSNPDSVSGGYDGCLYNPTTLRACTYPYQQYCTYTDQGETGRLTADLTDNRRGYSRSIIRGCSAVDVGSTCGEISMGGVTFEQCNKSCTSDGCNQGMGGSSRPATSITVLAASSLIIHALHKTFTQ